MKDFEKMLENMDEEKGIVESSEDLNELEQRRIWERTMEKIHILEQYKNQKEDSILSLFEGTKQDEMHLDDFEEEREERNNMRGKKVRRFSKGFVGVAAAVGIMALAGGTALASAHISDFFKSVLDIHDEESQKKVVNMIANTSAEDTNAGVTVKVDQIIGDNAGFYAILRVKNAPAYIGETVFGESTIKVDGISEKQSISWTEPTEGGYSQNEDTEDTCYTLKVSTENIRGKKIHLGLKNIGYNDEEGNFHALKKGNWNLDWTLDYKDESKTIAVNKDIDLMTSKAVWKSLVISPLSVAVKCDIIKQGAAEFSSEEEAEKHEGTDRLVVNFMDGTRLDSRFAEDAYSNDFDFCSLKFDKVMKLSDIESVSFCGKTVVLNENKNPIERTRYTSKVGNFTLDLPKKLDGILTMKEEENVHDKDFNCNSHRVTFTGKKNGCTMNLFTIYRLKGMYADADLERCNPFMKYIGYRGGYTYAILISEITDEKELENFADILNEDIATCLPFFEYLK